MLFTFPFRWSQTSLNESVLPPKQYIGIYVLSLVGALSLTCANVAKVALGKEYSPTGADLTRMLTASSHRNYEFKPATFEMLSTLVAQLADNTGLLSIVEFANSKRPVIFFRQNAGFYVWDSDPVSAGVICPLAECGAHYRNPATSFFVVFQSDTLLTNAQAASVGLWREAEPSPVVIPPPPPLPVAPTVPATPAAPPAAAVPVFKLSVLRGCNAKDRFDAWKRSGGTLLGLKNLGCGINALTFLGVLTRAEGERLVPLVNNRGTTLTEMLSYVYRTTHVPQYERYFSIRSVAEVQQFVDTLSGMLKPNECTIAKLMRFPDDTPVGSEPECMINGKSVRLTPGHSIVFSKDAEGTLHFLDPHLEIPPKPSVNAEKAFGAWSRQCYVAVGLLFGAFTQTQPKQATQPIPQDVQTISRQELPDHGPYVYRDAEMEADDL